MEAREEMSFDANNLTLGEVALVEDMSGLPIGAIAEDDKPKGKALAALILVMKKREDPKYTMAQAMNMQLSEATALLGGDDDDATVDPTDPKGGVPSN